jgi:sigma-B regulation protein RsbU (phosphoserine phosphatase)
MPPRSPARPWQYLLLALLLAVAGTYHLRTTFEIVRARLEPGRAPREPLETRGFTAVVAGTRPEAAAAGINVGDRLIAVEGRPYLGRRVLSAAVAERTVGQELRLSVASPAGAAREVALRLAGGAGSASSEAFAAVLLGIAMPLLCLGLGFAVAGLRPWDPLARLLLFLLLGFANFFSLGEPAAWGNLVRVPSLAYHWFFEATWPAGVLLFGLYFPDHLALDRRWPWLKWILLFPLLAHALVTAASALAISESVTLASRLEPVAAAFRPWLNVLYMLGVSAGFAALGYKGGTATKPDVKRRLALITWGGQIGLGPIGVLAVASIATGRPLDAIAPGWLTVAAMLVVPVFPAMLAYVVLVHRALDLRNTIRQGLQYALARGGIRALQVAVSAALIFSAAGLVAAPEANRPRRIAVVALGIAFVFVSRLLAEKLLAFTDRRFFREAYDAERMLSELSEEVRTIPDTAALLRTMAARIGDTLHVPRLAVLLRRGDLFAVEQAIGLGGSDPCLAADGRVAARLARDRRPAFVYADDPTSWLWRDEVPDAERAALSALHAQLLLPMAVKDRLVGVLALGPKLSEEAYSPSDVRLLSSVAGQTALALENARLTQAVADEAAQRARMTREIEIAREVQESLFPQDHPAVPGLDYAGHCRPARGVGGDYFDFRALEGGGLGVAIGDVSGKGVPAALLMASLQASIRGQELAGTDLGALMSNVNRMVYEASPSNRYATLFYGRYDPASRRLRYVNAGHNPPMLFRTAGGLERLDVGGPVVGLIPRAAYDEGLATLCAGDLLVLYTDGISEAMTTADEEWGEERLAASIREAFAGGAGTLLDHVFHAAEAFAGGADQYDDMTLVVLRVKA